MAYDTVRAATAPELAYIRSLGQFSRLYLAFLQPATVYSATLQTVPSSNDRVVQIAYTGGTGTLANVRKDMSLYVGTTAGAYDLGVARIRKAPVAGTFYIGEESDIRWDTPGTVYLTVVNEFDLWARHIRTVSDTEFYIDHDVAYSNQNTVFDPVPVMGGHRVLKLTGATVSTIFNWSNSWVIDSSISSYSVSCPTASAVTGGTTATPTITFNATGWHPVYLTVNASNGKTYTGMRYVYVYSNAAMPSTVFQLENCSVDYDTGGWSFGVTVQSGIALANVPERALCILFAEDYYGDTQVSIGQLAGCENVIAVGKISEERININPEQSEISLNIQGYQYWFNQTHAFPTGVLSTPVPSNWAEMPNPTVKKVLYRLLHWGCTATTIMDVYLPDDTKLATELVSPAASIWAQMQEIAFSTIQARTGVDRFGRFFAEVEPQLVPLGSRSWATVMTLTKADWYDAVSVERVVVTPTGLIDLSGVIATSSDDGEAYFSLSPGHVFKRYGAPEVVDRLLLSSQAMSNQQAGLFLGWRNNPYPSNEFNLLANNRMIDCFPRQKIAWSISVNDTPRAFSLSGNFIPRRVEFKWDIETLFLETAVTLELESVEQVSSNGDIPGGGGDSGSIVPPSPSPSPIAPFPPIVIPGEMPSTATMKAIVHNANVGLLYTENFNEEDGANVKWRTINAGMTGGLLTELANYKSIDRIIRHGSQLYVAHRNHSGFGTRPFIAYAPFPGATFTVIEDVNTISAKHNGTGFAAGVVHIGLNPLTGQVLYGIGTLAASDNIGTYIGSGTSFALASTVGPRVGAIGTSSFGGNKWRITGSVGADAKLWIMSPSGAYESLHDAPNYYSQKHVPISTTHQFYWIEIGFESPGVQLGDNTGASAPVGDLDVNPELESQLSCDPSGQYCMMVWGAGQRGRSSDGMATAVGIPVLSFQGAYSFCYIGGKASQSHWAASSGGVYYSKDWGSTWSDQSGDIRQLAPTGALTQIEVWY